MSPSRYAKPIRGPQASLSGDSSNFRLPVRPGPFPAKINAPGIFPPPDWACSDRRSSTDRAFGAGELIVEAQPERQRQLVAHFEFVVDPRAPCSLVERRIDRNDLGGLMHLAQQERRERIAGLGEIVAAGVVAARAKAIEVERRRRCCRPPAERELCDAGTRIRLSSCAVPSPTSGRSRTASDRSSRSRTAASLLPDRL